MIIDVLIVFNDMLQTLLFVLFINGILTSKKSRLATSLIFITVISLSYLATMPFRVNIKPLVMVLMIAIVIYLLYRDTLKKKMIVTGILIFFVMISEGVGILLFLLLSNFNFNLFIDFSIQRLIASVLFNLVFISISTPFNLSINKFHGRIRRNMIAFSTVMPISYTALIMVLFYNNFKKIDEDILLYATLGMVISVVTDIVIFNIVKSQKTILNEEKSTALMNIQHDLEYKYYKLALEESQKATKVKHDMLNQLQTIYSLFLSDDTRQKETGMEIVESLKTRLENIQETVYCENRMVNIILTLKIQEARTAGIEPCVSISIPEDIQIEKMDLCSVFSNILDNAIESCGKVEGTKKMEIRTGMKLGYLIIKVINSYSKIAKDSNGRLISLKQDNENHGLGLKIITDIAKKYDGDFEYDYTENEFIATVTLLQNGKKH